MLRAGEARASDQLRARTSLVESLLAAERPRRRGFDRRRAALFLPEGGAAGSPCRSTRAGGPRGRGRANDHRGAARRRRGRGAARTGSSAGRSCQDHVGESELFLDPPGHCRAAADHDGAPRVPFRRQVHQLIQVSALLGQRCLDLFDSVATDRTVDQTRIRVERGLSKKLFKRSATFNQTLKEDRCIQQCIPFTLSYLTSTLRKELIEI